jgi:hypothetical protein
MSRTLLITICLIGVTASQAKTDDPGRDALARSLSRLIRDAIPREYDKKDDWGATTEIVVGVRPQGKPFHWHIKEHKKTVNHGVWKHYRLRLVEPEQNLVVQLTNLQPLPEGRVAFTLRVEAKLDAWARAKAYQYGMHLMALEVESDMRLGLDVAGEVGLRVATVEGSPGFAVQPIIKDARVQLAEFHVRRVSNARGPLVQELGDGVRRIVEDEINGPPLAAKLNRAIEKKRDRLTFSASDLLKSEWRPLSRAPGSASTVKPDAAAGPGRNAPAATASK